MDEAVADRAGARLRARDGSWAPRTPASDESGDAHMFTQRLAEMAQAKGAKFLYKCTVKGIAMEGDAGRGRGA